MTNYFDTKDSFYFDLNLFGFQPDDFDLMIDYSLITQQADKNDSIIGLHLLFYYSLFSLELVVSPPFFFNDQTYSIQDALDNFSFPDTVAISLTNTKPAAILANIEFAARFGMTISSLDFYLSYFHGFDNRALFTTNTLLSPPENLVIEITQEYTLLDRIGASVSYDLFGMIIHAETVMSFSDPVLYYQTTSLPDPMGDIINTKIKNIMTLEISAGLDWEVFTNFRILFELTDFFYLRMSPMSRKKPCTGTHSSGPCIIPCPCHRVK